MAWDGQFVMSHDVYMHARPLLRAEFRNLRKDGAYWCKYCKDERRMWSVYGLSVPYQSMTAFRLYALDHDSCWQALMRDRMKMEVPRGRCVELLACCTYVGKYMMQEPLFG